MNSYDLAIIGLGPCGTTAGLYAGRYGLKTIIFGEVYGGTLATAIEIGNFPGVKKISGVELTQNMIEQVRDLGIHVVNERINDIKKEPNGFLLNGKYHAKKVILATGTKRRHLGLPREEALVGKGISYCTACDGIFFRDKVVAVVGGGDAALSSAVQLADIAKKVYIIYRGKEFFRAESIWRKLVEENPKIIKIYEANVIELIGEDRLKSIRLDNEIILNTDGLFVEIGAYSDKEFLQKIGLKLDENGYVITDRKMHTNIPGLFSAGEVNSGTFAQAIVSASDGAIAANSVYKEIKAEETKI